MNAQGKLIMSNKSWDEAWRGSASLSSDVKLLLGKLSESPLGAKLIAEGEKKAAETGLTLSEMIGENNSSFTDFSVRRRQVAGKIELLKSAKVFIDKNVTTKRAVFDLAHELVHYIWQTAHDPYDEKIHFSDYLKHNIEGQGGEVDAFLMECRVAREFSPRSWSNSYPCKFVSENNEVSRELALKAFYRVGEIEPYLAKYLGADSKDFPYLSPNSPLLIAGTRNHPYPLTLLAEFKEMREQACGFEKKRVGRSPASRDQIRLATLCDF